MTRLPPILRLYIRDVPPATIGMYANLPCSGVPSLNVVSGAEPSSGLSWNGISLIAKSTVLLRKSVRPALDPVPE